MIFFLIFLLLLALFLQQTMGGRALDRLTCRIRAEDYLVEPEAPFSITLTVENHSRLPVLFLRVRCAVPEGAELVPGQKGAVQRLAHSAEYRFDCFLMPRRHLEHTVQFRIAKRGGYQFTGLRLETGDFLGLDETSDRYPGSCWVVILPKRPEEPVHRQVLGGLMGDRSVNRWIHEDPVLSAGFREYTGREPMKTISWNRSLQSGRLMVRQMDHTAEQIVTVLLNLDGGSWDDREVCFRLCRGVCEMLEQRHLSYAFLHNGMLQTAVGILPTLEAGPNNLPKILEGLGRAVPTSAGSLASMVNRVLARGRESGCFLLITPVVDGETRRLVQLLETRTGGIVELIHGRSEVEA